jgi:soluble lytic murein transglycosylase
MLKESAFRPAVVSGAHAVGLMQLLPRTAAALQAAAGRPSEPLADLFDPAVNIGLACEYLRLLADRFGGQLPLVAAAYNAGPESVASWFRGRPTERLDVFVENIPFRETRDYVKKVVEFAVTYRVVHGGLPLSRAIEGLSPTLDLTPRLGVTF